MQNITDIWDKVCDGDSQAWELLVIRYEALVHTVGRRMGLSATEAEDCAQHTWISLYRNRRAVRDPHRLAMWLIRTTRRRAQRMVQQRSRTVRVQFDPETPSMDPLPDDELLSLERQAHIEIAMRRLDGRCRQLVEALFFAPSDKSYKDIAGALGIPANSLGPTRTRCLNKLRKILIEIGYL